MWTLREITRISIEVSVWLDLLLPAVYLIVLRHTEAGRRGLRGLLAYFGIIEEEE